jgi:hypothetical protein
MKKPFTATKHRARGFQRASGLVQPRIREASEKRGFAISRLLTHWAEVVGPEFADMTRPVDISYGRKAQSACKRVLRLQRNIADQDHPNRANRVC